MVAPKITCFLARDTRRTPAAKLQPCGIKITPRWARWAVSEKAPGERRLPRLILPDWVVLAAFCRLHHPISKRRRVTKRTKSATRAASARRTRFPPARPPGPLPAPRACPRCPFSRRLFLFFSLVIAGVKTPSPRPPSTSRYLRTRSPV